MTNTATKSEELRRIFRDDRFEKQIRDEGIAVVDLLTPDQHQELIDLVHRLNDAGDVDHSDVHLNVNFRLSAFYNDSAYKRRIYDKVFALLGEAYNNLLLDYEPLVINLFDKLPGAGSVAIHQNPSFVYEPKFKSVSVWIPMIDTTRENGTVGVLRGSHDVFDAIRASNQPDIFAPCARQLTEVYFEPLNLKRGQAAVLDDSVVHWSYPNLSKERRAAVQLISVPKEAEHVYFYYNASGPEPIIEEFDVNKEFFFVFNCKERPDGLKHRRSYPFKYSDISEAEVLKKVGPRNPSILQKQR